MGWLIVRPFVPGKTRWFFEGHPALHGQLWFEDRRLLYNTVLKARPSHCFEIGTWKGGGSTLFIGNALHRLGSGILHTIEINNEFYEEAVNKYKVNLPHLKPYVVFHLGDYREKYSKILKSGIPVDFAILDGAEDPKQTLEQYQFFRPFFKSGAILMLHDWFTEKTALVRPILERSAEWEIITVLAPPKSVGFVVAARK